MPVPDTTSFYPIRAVLADTLQRLLTAGVRWTG
jgi:hypothetical protein